MASRRKTRIAAREMLLPAILAAGVAGYWLAPTDPLDTEVKQAGVFTTDTHRTLSATVESLRAESRLLVYSYRGAVRVEAERSALLFLGGHQKLTVPATVGYHVDLSDLSLDDLHFDERSQSVTVTLPPLVMGDVAFQPEEAEAINGGILTWSQWQVDELSRANYENARRAFAAQAQSPAIVDAARREAKEAVAALFELPLRASGQPNVRVEVRFASP